MAQCLTRDRRFEPHRRHCVVSLSKNINPSLVLVQPCPFIGERLLMGRKELNQKFTSAFLPSFMYRLLLLNTFFKTNWGFCLVKDNKDDRHTKMAPALWICR